MPDKNSLTRIASDNAKRHPWRWIIAVCVGVVWLSHVVFPLYTELGLLLLTGGLLYFMWWPAAHRADERTQPQYQHQLGPIDCDTGAYFGDGVDLVDPNGINHIRYVLEEGEIIFMLFRYSTLNLAGAIWKPIAIGTTLFVGTIIVWLNLTPDIQQTMFVLILILVVTSLDVMYRAIPWQSTWIFVSDRRVGHVPRRPWFFPWMFKLPRFLRLVDVKIINPVESIAGNMLDGSGGIEFATLLQEDEDRFWREQFHDQPDIAAVYNKLLLVHAHFVKSQGN